MKKNIGFSDKLVRAFGALALASLYFTGIVKGAAAVVILSISFILLITALIGICPLYAVFGINTCYRKKSLS